MPVELIDGEHTTLVVEALKIILSEELLNPTCFNLTETFRDVLLEDVEGNTRLMPLLARRPREGLLHAG